jgi:hypothetical protein
MNWHLAILARPDLDGPREVVVGGSRYNIPEDAEVVYARDDQLLLVEHRDAVHVYTNRGELWTPGGELMNRVRRYYFGNQR